MKPSETSRGGAWLTNFLPEDQGAARELLDSIMFVSLSTVRRQLVQHLQELIDVRTIEPPALVVPALSIEDINETLGLPRDEAPKHHVAYQTYEVGAPIAALPGSEGFIGNVIRDLLRRPTSDSRWLASGSTLEDLRTARCRSVVLVSDYAGSGNQIIEFARTFTRHHTIRSWRSGGYVKVHAVTYAASTTTLDRASQPHSPIDSLTAVRASPTFADRPWNTEERQTIEQLCLRKATTSYDALGYKGSRGLFATEAGAPNNLPKILRQVGPQWVPFFEGRTVPPDLAIELEDYEPELTSTGLVAVTQQARLARALDSRPMRSANADLLKLLALLERGRRNPYQLAATTSMHVDRVADLLRALQSLELIDARGLVTSRGRNEIRSSKRIPRQVTFTTAASDDEYYPRSMR